MPYKLNPHTNMRDYYVNEMYSLFVGDIFAKSPDGTVFEISIENDGALTSNVSSYAGYIPTLVIKAANGIKYLLGVDDDGALTSDPVGNYSISKVVVISPGGTEYLVGVDNDGAITVSNFSL